MNTFLTYLAQILTPEQIKSMADELAQKDFKWWFAAVFIIMIISGLMVFRWLIQQLADQRKANADERIITNQIQDKLLNYLKEDHSKSLLVMSTIESQLSLFTDSIKTLINIEQRRETKELRNT